jgi:hypothetical protein
MREERIERHPPESNRSISIRWQQAAKRRLNSVGYLVAYNRRGD